MEQPFPALSIAATALPCLPSLSHHEPSPRCPFEPLDTAPSSAPTLGAPSTSLLMPLAAPLLHHRRSLPLILCRCGTPRSGEPCPLFGHQTGLPHCWLSLRPLHRRPPAAGCLDFTGKSSVPMREKASPISPRAERLHGLGWEGRGQMGLAHSTWSQLHRPQQQ
jgi:hypothetical protein